MALARVKVWNAGDVLKAADLNSEFNNILNNPVSLLSPTTGAINFNLTAHTNLVVTALSATSGSTGNVLTVSTGGTPVWSSTGVFANFTSFTSGQIPVGTTSGALAPIAIGTTGQVLSVTSSNSTPVWGVIPLSGGLTTGAPASGAIFYVSTSSVMTALGIGTSGQVLTVSTVPLPSWAAAAAGSTGAAVKVASTVMSTGNLTITSTSFTAMTTTLSITPNTTAARLLIKGDGTIAVSPDSAGTLVLITPFLDGANLGSATQGIWQYNNLGTGALAVNIGLSLSHLTSVVSTAAHTVQFQALISTANNIVVQQSNPTFRLSAIEINTTG